METEIKSEVFLENYTNVLGEKFNVYTFNVLEPKTGDYESLYFKAVSQTNLEKVCSGAIGISRTLEALWKSKLNIKNDYGDKQLRDLILKVGLLHVKCALESEDFKKCDCGTIFRSCDLSNDYNSAIKFLESDLQWHRSKRLSGEKQIKNKANGKKN